MDDSERDYHNFSTSSSHRLPTISGTQAIRDAVQKSKPIPTSLASLDTILSSHNATQPVQGGLQRGVVTEVYGPPGVGKTSFVLQAAVNAIHSSIDASNVTWIDTSSALVGLRLQQLMDGHQCSQGHEPASSPPPPRQNGTTLLEDKFNYIQIASLHNLLALFMHPHADFPLPKTGLVVLDDLSNLLLSSLPRVITTAATTESQQTPSTIRSDHLTKQSSSRRFHIISNFGLALQKFAATHNIAILVIAKATVTLKAGQRATLRSALTSQQWDACLSTRIALFRDSWPEQVIPEDPKDQDEARTSEGDGHAFRCAQVVRLRGKEVITRGIGFIIEENGLKQVDNHQFQPDLTIRTVATQQLPNLADGLEGEDTNAEQRDEVFAVQREGLHDAANIEDADLTYEHDTGKRKAAEIADSDDDENYKEPNPSQPPSTPQMTGLPSTSQVGVHQSTHHDPKFQTAKKYRTAEDSLRQENQSQSSADNSVSSQRDTKARDEMLFDLHESDTSGFDRSQTADENDSAISSDDREGPS